MQYAFATMNVSNVSEEKARFDVGGIEKQKTVRSKKLQ